MRDMLLLIVTIDNKKIFVSSPLKILLLCLKNSLYAYMSVFCIRLSLEYKRSRGEYTGLAPIGYKNIQNQKNKSDVIVDTERAPIIVKLFNAYATGQYTIKQLTKLAHSLGLVNRQNKPIQLLKIGIEA